MFMLYVGSGVGSSGASGTSGAAEVSGTAGVLGKSTTWLSEEPLLPPPPQAANDMVIASKLALKGN
tara:strand:- start:208 stop:405 length:198 start_codon:yes stop_codon:yes gene_type:complete